MLPFACLLTVCGLLGLSFRTCTATFGAGFSFAIGSLLRDLGADVGEAEWQRRILRLRWLRGESFDHLLQVVGLDLQDLDLLCVALLGGPAQLGQYDSQADRQR